MRMQESWLKHDRTLLGLIPCALALLLSRPAQADECPTATAAKLLGGSNPTVALTLPGKKMVAKFVFVGSLIDDAFFSTLAEKIGLTTPAWSTLSAQAQTTCVDRIKGLVDAAGKQSIDAALKNPAFQGLYIMSFLEAQDLEHLQPALSPGSKAAYKDINKEFTQGRMVQLGALLAFTVATMNDDRFSVAALGLGFNPGNIMFASRDLGRIFAIDNAPLNRKGILGVANATAPTWEATTQAEASKRMTEYLTKLDQALDDIVLLEAGADPFTKGLKTSISAGVKWDDKLPAVREGFLATLKRIGALTPDALLRIAREVQARTGKGVKLDGFLMKPGALNNLTKIFGVFGRKRKLVELATGPRAPMPVKVMQMAAVLRANIGVGPKNRIALTQNQEDMLLLYGKSRSGSGGALEAKLKALSDRLSGAQSEEGSRPTDQERPPHY